MAGSYTYNRISKDDAVVLLVDHQAGLISLVQDHAPSEFKNNVLALGAVAKFFGLPTILTTSFEDGPNGPIVPALKEMFPEAPFLARPGQINAWDNEDFVKAVKDTGKKQIIIAGVVTDVCVAFPTLSALEEGYEVFVVVDASGTFNETVRDAAIMLSAMASVDPKDTTSADVPVEDYEAALEGAVRGRRIGVPNEYRVEGMPEEIERLWSEGRRWLSDAGAEIVDISLPHTKYALPAYYIVAPAEASSNLARYDGVRYGHRAQEFTDVTSMYENSRAEGFGDEVKRRILIGTYVLSAGYYDAYYLRAQKVRKKIFDEFVDAFKKVDLILTPSTPSAAFALGEKTADPVQMYLNDVFTVTGNLAGLPGGSVPAACPSACSSLRGRSMKRPCSAGSTPSSRPPASTLGRPSGGRPEQSAQILKRASALRSLRAEDR